MSVTITDTTGVPIHVRELPDLGSVTDSSKFVADHGGTGLFSATALLAYMQLTNGVTPEQYGAAGDGITDDTTAINAAVASGRPVLFSGKTYNVSGTINGPQSGQRMIGTGVGSTIIRSTSDGAPVFAVANHAVGAGVIGMTITRTVPPSVTGHGITTPYSGAQDAVSQVVLSDLLLTGHYRGLDLGPTDYSLARDITVDSCYGDAVCLTATSGNGAAYTAPLQWTLDHVLCQKCNGHGYLVTGVAQVMAGFGGAPMGEWKNVSSFANSGGGAAFVGVANGGIADIRISSNSFFGGDGNNEIYLETFSSNHYINAFIELAGQGGATGQGLGSPVSNTGRGVFIDAHNSGVKLHDCIISACSFEGVASSASLFGSMGAPVILSSCMIINNGVALLGGAQAGVTLDPSSTCGMVIHGGYIGQQNEAPGSGPQIYGVQIGRDAITIVGCQITGNATAPLSLSATLTPAHSYIDPSVRAAGAAGEYRSSTQDATVALSSAVTNAVITLSLPAGDWDVSGVVQFQPAGTTTVAAIIAGINNSPSLAALNTGYVTQIEAGLTTGVTQVLPVGPVRINQATTGNIYLLAQAAFATSTMTCGGTLNARRVI